MWQALLFNKIAGFRPAFWLKKRLWNRCFPVIFAKFIRTPFIIEHLWWMLLIFFNLQYTCAEMPKSSLSRSMFIFLLPPLFWIFQPLVQDQQSGKRTHCLSVLTFRIDPRILGWTAWGFVSPEHLMSLYLSSMYISSWLGEIFKFMMLKILETAFWIQKVESSHFCTGFQAELFPRFLSSPSRRNLLWQKWKGFTLTKVKRWPKLNLREY